VAANTDCCHHF